MCTSSEAPDLRHSIDFFLWDRFVVSADLEGGHLVWPVCSLRDSVSMRYKFTSSCWHCGRIQWGSQPSARLEVTGKDVGMKMQEEERLRREGGIYVLTVVPP